MIIIRDNQPFMNIRFYFFSRGFFFFFIFIIEKTNKKKLKIYIDRLNSNIESFYVDHDLKNMCTVIKQKIYDNILKLKFKKKKEFK